MTWSNSCTLIPTHLFVTISSCQRTLRRRPPVVPEQACCECSVDIMQMRSGGRNASEEGPRRRVHFQNAFAAFHARRAVIHSLKSNYALELLPQRRTNAARENDAENALLRPLLKYLSRLLVTFQFQLRPTPGARQFLAHAARKGRYRIFWWGNKTRECTYKNITNWELPLTFY